ncbi:MAG TPA: MliC family protein [Rhodospirillales bacterium]|nr:MliC family protein [Rhodospirillales bacterium]
MRPVAATLASLLFLAACAGDTESPTTMSFLCHDGTVLNATFLAEDDQMLLRVNDRTYDLSRLISASGARYGEGQTMFWNKGREAMLQRSDGPSYFGCLQRP